MLQLFTNYDLATRNTFGMAARAAYFSPLTDVADLARLSTFPQFSNGLFVLGGGSNILFTKNIAEWVIHNQIKGIVREREDTDYVWLRVSGGEVWHDFVTYCVADGYGGVENLALIPGTVGAAPIQNIGAYGAEVKDVIESVRGWHFGAGEFRDFTASECQFGYRSSIFKQAYKQKLLVTSVLFRLRKEPEINLSYAPIRQALESTPISDLSIRDVAEAVIHIRRSKLPDPNEIGNAGSFFKNPEVGREVFEALKERCPDVPCYDLPNGRVKIPAAWLIERCGWKGRTFDHYGVHQRQALVLVNYGGASGAEIAGLADAIRKSVADRYGILLEKEVQIY